VTFLVKLFVDWFLKTEVGLALRATGDNQRMIRSFSANTDYLIILGLGVSNALVATSGALFAQYTSFADIGMGIGMIVIGLASVIIGEALIGTKTLARATLAVVIGAILYRIVLSLALQIDFFDTGDMKLITATIVIIALIIPRMLQTRKDKARKKKRMGAMRKEGGDVA
ncbi:MAG TPA: ABC transporter permease, partial [Massilibacterium sp.]|nr:ABC transporter permease [Massilibacterium sp.]